MRGVSQMEIMNLGEIKAHIQEEEYLSENILHLTANETLLSPLAHSALSSNLYNRYLLEHLDMRGKSPSRLGNFVFRGLNHINEIERSAIEVCYKMFGAKYVEFRCLSGLHAMQTTIVSLSNPGDTIMRVATKDGGHFLTETICKVFGRKSCSYVFDRETRQLDVGLTQQVIEKEKPVLLFIDAMNYVFPFPIRELREIAGDIPIVFDASHTLGLIAGGEFQDPLHEGADILQANTHKTFFGPQKGIILSGNPYLMDRINYTLSNGMVSSQHTNSTLALFIALHEMYYYGKEYATQVVKNAQYLAEAVHTRGLPVLEAEHGFTKNHMFFIDVRLYGLGNVLLERLIRANISTNRSNPFEHIDALRIGVQEITRRGFTESDLNQISEWLGRLIIENDDPRKICTEVIDLVRSRRSILYCDDIDIQRNQTLTSNASTIVENLNSDQPRWNTTKLEQVSCVIETQHDIQSVQRLAAIAAEFDQQLDSAGNVSFRYNDSMFISTSGSYIKDLSPNDFTEITKYENFVLYCRGPAHPSTESYMHYLIYKHVDAAVVVHNHYILKDELEGINIEIVSPKEYGSFELAESVAQACERSHIVYVRMHGLIFWGETVRECEELLNNFGNKIGFKFQG